MNRLLIGLLLSGIASVGLAGGLDGDPKALERVDNMLAALGGRELWANARSLYTVERARHPDYGDGIEATFWRDLEKPGEYARLVHDSLDVNYGWDEEAGWISRNGELRDFDAGELKERRFYWGREVYTLYRQLARGERGLTVRALEPNGFYVLDEEGDKIGIFRLTPNGDLYLWEQVGGKEPVSFIYGPHKNFGQVSFPDWGTATDGGWGFYFVQVRPSTKTFNANVDIAKPELKWSGGALHTENCRE